MAKMTGLGKGLDALFAGASPIIEEKEPEELKLKENEIVKNLKIIEVEPNRSQPRKKFDEESLEELAESIKRYGLIQPIVVSKRDDYYEIVAGERRWRAAKMAGLTEIPVVIREYDERKNKEIALIENVQREDLNAYEKAMAMKHLMEDYKLTQEQVAKVLGKRRSSIANTVRILNLDSKVLELVKEGKLTEGHCKALLSISDPNKQYNMAVRMIERGASVREVEKKTRARKNMGKGDEKYVAVIRNIEDSFQSFFGTKVRLDPGKKKGKIVIEYSSNEDLERILDLIK